MTAREKASAHPAPAPDAAHALRPEPRLLIVSNRLPVTVAVRDGVADVRPSVGGLATGLAGPHERSGGLWIGWPGGDLDALGPDAADAARRQLAERRCAPVALTDDEVRVFYQRVSNGVLWPLFHDRLDRLPLVTGGWDVYEAVNARFADAVAAHYRPGDVVWVHDYQLLRVPHLLRERLPDARIGFFLHIPFPSPELFATLPTRRWLLEGLLGADLVGFHTRRYRGHFADAVRRLFHAETAWGSARDAEGGARLAVGARTVRLGVFPMGVDAAALGERADARAVTAEALALKTSGPPPNGQRLLVGVDRLDYSKGIPRRLLALEHLLTRHPEWRGRVRLVQVAVPSRGELVAYRRFRDQVDRLVGRINGRFATPTWTPVHYLHRSVPETTLLALYRAADVMLVTPVRDGMNLVAKEFAACRNDEDGVLVLSEFAGASAELAEALLVNPYDVPGTADALHAALTMEPAERRRRMRALRAQVRARDVHRWAAAFLATLGRGDVPERPGEERVSGRMEGRG